MHLERKLFLTSIILFLLIIGASFVVGKKAGDSSDISEKKMIVDFGTSRFTVEVVDDEASRARGLGGRERLDEGTGMLFVFDTEDIWGIWMKDMKLAIDVVWLDKTGKVISVEKNMSPETYPKIFFPTKRARYVLEVPAGALETSGVSVNSVIDLSSLSPRVPL